MTEITVNDLLEGERRSSDYLDRTENTPRIRPSTTKEIGSSCLVHLGNSVLVLGDILSSLFNDNKNSGPLIEKVYQDRKLPKNLFDHSPCVLT